MIEAYKFNFKFDEPVKIAWKTFHHNAGNLLMIKGKNTGYGEAVPDPFITKDDEETVFKYLRENASLIPNTADLDVIKKVHRQLPVGSPTARAAIDFALHDLWGKEKGKQVWELYSSKVNEPLNCMTVFGKDVNDTKATVVKLIQDYPHLKVIKIKLMGKNDIDRCKAVKEVSPGMSYVLDCNQGYKTSAEAITVLNELKGILGDIILVEEPVPARQWDLLKEVTNNVDIPVFADESAVNLEDVKTIIQKKCANGINIKLQKTGGIWPAKIIAEECEKHGLQVMVGCMFESSVGIAAGLHFARSTKNVILTDLDFDLQMDDVYKFRPSFEDGIRKPSGKPGLGVELDMEKVKKFANFKKII